MVIGVLGLIVAGIVGYFSGIAAVNKQINALDTLANTNKFRIDGMQPSVEKVVDIEIEQSRQKDRLDDLERGNNNAATIRGIIQIRDDQVKSATVQYLERLIEEIKSN